MRRATWGLVLGLLAAGGVGTAAGQGGQGTVVDLGGLKSRTPAEWKEQPVSPIQKQGGRLLHFVLPKVEGDKLDADVLVFYFGGQGGSVKENLPRWKGMFIPPQGKSIDEVTKVEEFKVGQVPVTSVDIHGTYKFKKAPFVPDEQAERRPDHRMIAVYFDSKNGPYYLRFVGPEKTVAHYKAGFDKWLRSFE
jgi:hypothetical protein